MKKILLAAGLILILFSPLFLLPALAIEGTATVPVKDLFALANRKTYRLGIRGTLISPTSNILITKNSIMDFGLEFDAKLNENLDTGPRFGYLSYSPKTSAVDGSYGILKFGYGARIYFAYWGDYGSTHGFVNAYGDAEVDYYTATMSGGTLTSPPNAAGVGGYVGGGLEFAFGPNTSGFAGVGYQKTSINSGDGKEIPLDGFLVQVGTRLAFF